MIRNLTIGRRLLVLLSVQLMILLAMGGGMLFALQNQIETEGRLNELVERQGRINALAQSVQEDLRKVVVDPYVGSISWEQAEERISEAQNRFEDMWKRSNAKVLYDKTQDRKQDRDNILNGIREVYGEVRLAIEERDRARLFSLLVNDYEALTQPYFDELARNSEQQKTISASAFQAAVAQSESFFYVILVSVIAGVLIAGALGFLIYRSISQPISRIADTVKAVNDGDYTMRARVEGDDELGTLGEALDTLLEEKVTALTAAEAENERLNNSIIELVRAVAEISQKDFTVKVPVSEDVIGTVASSLNVLTEETSEVLGEVQHISKGFAQIADVVKQQANAIIKVADAERLEVEETAKVLESSAQTMTRISRDAQAANETADTTMKNTQTALETVTKTVEGIEKIRDTIGETEKRIKRLGERSQEITGIVNLINNIAERTQILALNASMHAASAGEAGRGFAVVANEVQRLAESAREATSEISTLIDNIRIETVDTVTTVNKAITEVAEGTRLAEQAGESMRGTQLTTSELVKSVQLIAKSSKEQAKASSALRDRAGKIEASTQQTTKHLKVQSSNTNKLVKYSSILLKSVSVFKLPDTEPLELRQAADSTEPLANQRAASPMAVQKEAV